MCEISYSKGLPTLSKRLREWHDDWVKVCYALTRDSFLNEDWPVRPWLFVPEQLVPLLLRRLEEIGAGEPLKFSPRITTLEKIQPWQYQSWNRTSELDKPVIVPEAMRA